MPRSDSLNELQEFYFRLLCRFAVSHQKNKIWSKLTWKSIWVSKWGEFYSANTLSVELNAMLLYHKWVRVCVHDNPDAGFLPYFSIQTPQTEKSNSFPPDNEQHMGEKRFGAKKKEKERKIIGLPSPSPSVSFSPSHPRVLIQHIINTD